VRSGRDALELMLAGAGTVSVGTAIFHDPSACPRIVRELEEELANRGIERAAEVVGLAHEAGRLTRQRMPGSAS
jgi:dihydroorotate dehydrogenase (NAD+) catalytic subunit